MQENLENLVATIIENGGIGNAGSYNKLLKYLCQKALDENSSPPREIEIAQDVFGKRNFSQMTDSSVRVYVHNLRKKLDLYYENDGKSEERQLYIPKGSYALKWREPAETPLNTSAFKPALLHSSLPHFWLLFAAFVILLAASSFYIGLQNAPKHMTSHPANQNSIATWQAMRANNLPIIFALGDLYYFAETDRVSNTTRMVRDFTVNSDEDLESLQFHSKDDGIFIRQSELKYFSKGTIFALPYITKQFYGISNVSYKMASQLTPDDIRENNIIYIGLFKSLAGLQDIHKGTSFSFPENFGSIKDLSDNNIYTVEGDANKAHTDYGIYTQHIASRGNLIVTFASFSETALIQMAQQLTGESLDFLPETMTQSVPDIALFFTVSGYNRTNIETNLVKSAPLDKDKIWQR